MLMTRSALAPCLAAAALLATACRSPEAPQEVRERSRVVELDHVFTFAPRGSSEQDVVDAFRRAGFAVDGARNEFPDGPVGRYVFLGSTYLEILWLPPGTDADEDTALAAAWESSGASPFGVGLRRRPGAPDPLPFPSRGMTAEWMEPGTEMRILNRDTDTAAPSLFVVPQTMAMPHWMPRGSPAAPRHPAGDGVDLVRVRLVTTPSSAPAPLEALEGTGVEIATGPEPQMELTLRGLGRGMQHDLRPVLPVVLRAAAGGPARASGSGS